MGDGTATSQTVAERARGELSAEMAVMRLLLQHRSAAAVDRELAALAEDDHPDRRAVLELADLLRARAGAAAAVVAVADRADEMAGAGGLEAALDRCRRFFDWAVGQSPETSVALYSLGEPDSLAAATLEVVELLGRRGVLGPERHVLDVGCGIGRVETALAPRVASITGVDVSDAMVAEARRRCAALPNVEFRATSGRDLAPFGPSSFDTVIAIDSFPYFYQAGGPEFALAQLTEMARVVAPGGDIVALNLSYRGEPTLDRSDAERFSREIGLDLLCAGALELRSWDGRTFHWRRS